jgi:hypothetical protein
MVEYAYSGPLLVAVMAAFKRIEETASSARSGDTGSSFLQDANTTDTANMAGKQCFRNDKVFMFF